MSSEVRPTKRKREELGGVDSPRGHLVDASASKDNEHQTTIEIDVGNFICSIKFLPDGKHVVSAGREGKIRRWRVADGKEVGKPMETGSFVEDVAVSRDGKWIVAGTSNGRVTVWNATNHEKVTDFHTYSNFLNAVDISPDSTRIVTGSYDNTLSVWSLSTGQQLLAPFAHVHHVSAVKFSLDGQFIATAIQYSESGVRVYDSRDGRLLAQFPIYVSRGLNGCLAWTSDGKQLLVLSREGDIHRLEVSTWTTLSKWNIRETGCAGFIALTPNDRFIATSRHSSFSLWDATSNQHLATVRMPGPNFVLPMDISPNYDIAVAPEKKIILRHLLGILPSHYRDDMEPKPRRSRTETIDLGDTVEPLHVRNASETTSIASLEKVIQRLRDQLAASDRDNRSLRAQHESTKNRLEENVANLEKSAQGLRGQLAITNQEKENLKDTIQSIRTREENSTNRFNETVRSLRGELDVQKTSSADLEKTVQELTNQLAASQCALQVHEQKYQCEIMFASGRIYNAVQQLLDIINSMDEDPKHDELFMRWLEEFTDRCVTRLRAIGDDSSSTEKRVEAFSAYSAVLSLTSSPPNTLLMGWARMGLRCHTADEVLGGANKFMFPKFHLYRAVCDVLEEDDHVTQAIKCFRKMKNLFSETNTLDDQSQWELGFQQRCFNKLVNHADTVMD